MTTTESEGLNNHTSTSQVIHSETICNDGLSSKALQQARYVGEQEEECTREEKEKEEKEEEDNNQSSIGHTLDTRQSNNTATTTIDRETVTGNTLLLVQQQQQSDSETSWMFSKSYPSTKTTTSTPCMTRIHRRTGGEIASSSSSSSSSLTECKPHKSTFSTPRTSCRMPMVSGSTISTMASCCKAPNNNPSTVSPSVNSSFFSQSLIDHGKMLPLFRGKIHLFLVILSPFWVILLLSCCSSWQSYFAAGIASLSGFVNFLFSALLHNINWKASIYHTIERFDHAGIFMMISGSTTPIPILLLDFSISTALLLVQWSATIYGIYFIFYKNLSDGDKRKKRAFVYVLIGLGHVLFVSEYARVLTPLEFLLVVLLGVLYIIGALVYALKRPNPFPEVFGFHEIFHACCLGSAVCTFFLNMSVLKRAAE